MVWFVGGAELVNRGRVLLLLRGIFGVGKTMSKWILDIFGISFQYFLYDWDKYVIELYVSFFRKWHVGMRLRRRYQKGEKRTLNSYSLRSLCLRSGLPLRGQVTKSNARTRKNSRVGRIRYIGWKK